MHSGFRFNRVTLPRETIALRDEVRRFLNDEIAAGTFKPGFYNYLSEAGASAEFSRKLGAKGWIGVTWPKRYGGQERTYLDRFVITEELLSVGAPARGHWSAERQYGPLLLKYGTEAMRQELLPKIARGELFFCIGLSEPNSGSDLFSARTRADRVEGGWLVNGRKIWTSNAHNAQIMVALVRTSPARGEDRRFGLSQLLIDMATPGITVRPFNNMIGQRTFNEVLFEDVLVPEDKLIGELDQAWKQASGELAHERAGPERFMETIQTLKALVRAAGTQPSERVAEGIGREIAQLATLRRMTLSIAGMIQDGHTPAAEAAVTKDLGTGWEQSLPNKARLLWDGPANSDDAAIWRYDSLSAPNFTIGGGTREVLRGIIARGLGLR